MADAAADEERAQRAARARKALKKAQAAKRKAAEADAAGSGSVDAPTAAAGSPAPESGPASGVATPVAEVPDPVVAPPAPSAPSAPTEEVRDAASLFGPDSGAIGEEDDFFSAPPAAAQEAPTPTASATRAPPSISTAAGAGAPILSPPLTSPPRANGAGVAVNVRPAHRRSGSQSSSTQSRSHGRTASFATQTEGEASPEVLALRSTVQLLLGDKSSLTARLNELETRLEERVAEAQKAKEEATAQVDQAQRRLKEGFALQREAEGRERALVRRSTLTLQRNAKVLSLGV